MDCISWPSARYVLNTLVAIDCRFDQNEALSHILTNNSIREIFELLETSLTGGPIIAINRAIHN